MKLFLYENRKDVFLDVFYPGGFGRGVPPLSAGQPIPVPQTGGRLFPAALICPGGGYYIVGTTEARPVSDKFTEAGFAAFILHYTVGEDLGFGPEGWEGFKPVRDLIAAIRLLHEKSADFGIDPAEIVLAGFSAGGHLCAASCFSGALIKEGLLPKALILTYPMSGSEECGGAGKPQPGFNIARMPYTSDPAVKSFPVFMWHAKDDTMVPFEESERLAARLKTEHIPHIFLAYEHGVHTRPFFDPDWWFKALDWLTALNE